MSNFTAFKAGRGNEKGSATDCRYASRRPIFIDGPPAHAGIVQALRTAFGDGGRLPDNEGDDFTALLARLN